MQFFSLPAKARQRVKEKSPSHFIHEEYSRISTRVPMLKEWVKLLDGNNLLSLRGKIVPNPHADRAHYVLTVTRYQKIMCLSGVIIAVHRIVGFIQKTSISCADKESTRTNVTTQRARGHKLVPLGGATARRHSLSYVYTRFQIQCERTKANGKLYCDCDLKCGRRIVPLLKGLLSLVFR